MLAGITSATVGDQRSACDFGCQSDSHLIRTSQPPIIAPEHVLRLMILPIACAKAGGPAERESTNVIGPFVHRLRAGQCRGLPPRIVSENSVPVAWFGTSYADCGEISLVIIYADFHVSIVDKPTARRVVVGKLNVRVLRFDRHPDSDVSEAMEHCPFATIVGEETESARDLTKI